MTGKGSDRLVTRVLDEPRRMLWHQVEVARYVRGYREKPQTANEFGWSDEAARQHFTELDWADDD